VRSAILFLLALLILPTTSSAQYFNRAKSSSINCRISGRLDDYSHNEGADRRIFSSALGRPADLYVYVPPGYNPAISYPFILYLHPGSMDERAAAGSCWIVELDRLICCGLMPPVIVAYPDGTHGGENQRGDPHSLFINGCGGRFEDYLLNDIVPFVMSTYSIRPERGAHGILGASAGGYGGMGLALKHRELFGAIAAIASPLNMRYTTISGNYEEDFNPATFRWEECYDPERIIGRYYCGLHVVRARKYIDPVFACTCDVVTHIKMTNPADLLATTDLHPGELAILVGFGTCDNFNFDAQSESFIWLASQRGVGIDVQRIPWGKHDVLYFTKAHRQAYVWLGQHLIHPTSCTCMPTVPAPAPAPQPMPLPHPSTIQSDVRSNEIAAPMPPKQEDLAPPPPPSGAVPRSSLKPIGPKDEPR
jgi:hypothetical protein